MSSRVCADVSDGYCMLAPTGATVALCFNVACMIGKLIYVVEKLSKQKERKNCLGANLFTPQSS